MDILSLLESACKLFVLLGMCREQVLGVRVHVDLGYVESSLSIDIGVEESLVRLVLGVPFDDPSVVESGSIVKSCPLDPVVCVHVGSDLH